MPAGARRTFLRGSSARSRIPFRAEWADKERRKNTAIYRRESHTADRRSALLPIHTSAARLGGSKPHSGEFRR